MSSGVFKSHSSTCDGLVYKILINECNIINHKQCYRNNLPYRKNEVDHLIAEILTPMALENMFSSQSCSLNKGN